MNIVEHNMTSQDIAIAGYHKIRENTGTGFDDFVPKFQMAIDRSVILRCLEYAGDHDIDACCNEILSCHSGKTFLKFFDSLVESDNNEGLDGRFFADFFWYLGNPANFRALKVLLVEEVRFYRETNCFTRETY
jgi:hypothetical protein